jgi:long-chain fatty acid transport protein
MNTQTKRIALVITLALSPAAQATNGYQLIGIGSHQNSLGGAVTANPGSAMTAITNPAGMARIGKRADFSMEMFMPDRFVDFTGMGGERSDSAAKQYGVPALGWTAPVEDNNGDVYFGGGMYGTSGLGTDYGVTFYAPAAANPSGFDLYFDGYSMIQFWQMAPTLAWNVNKQLTIGGSLNIDYQSVSLKQKVTADTDANGEPDTTMQSVDLSRNAQAFGYGFTLGLLYDINPQFTVGFSYKSKQSFPDMEYQLARGDITLPTPLPATIPNCTDFSGISICNAGLYKLSLDFPAITSIGLAYSPVSALKLSFDVKYIQWSDTLKTLDISGPNGFFLPMASGWDDQTIYAFGVEYSVNQRLRVRAGYNTADAPIDAADVDNNLILPATVEKNIAVGADWRLSKFWDIGFHYGKATENVLTSSATPTKIGLGITTLGINLGYRF